MAHEMDRRRFLEISATTGLAATAASTVSAAGGANNTIIVGVMGVNGRGTALARGFAAQAGCEVAYICDVDSRAVDKAVSIVKGTQKNAPQGVTDFRKVLDDKSVDALVIAAPNHWHAPATILGCAAGKHVYVEKPCSHNPREGELMVAASRKNHRVVQLGTQRRSYSIYIQAIKELRAGKIGDVLFARSWYNSRRGSIGTGKVAEVPSWLNYELWQGPAPERPYHDNVVHYNWHWLWHWGCGEIGNNGVHSIDICRWGMGVDYPTRVSSGGGRLRFDDDQQTPDTHTVSYEFEGNKVITWEGLSWSPHGSGGSPFGISFHGDQGTMVMTGDNYKIYDMRNKEVAAESGGVRGDGVHLGNFLESIREDKRPNADIEDGHKSTLLCHLGNISQRTGRALHTDPTNGHILDDPEAAALWSREYRPGWEPKV